MALRSEPCCEICDYERELEARGEDPGISAELDEACCCLHTPEAIRASEALLQSGSEESGILTCPHPELVPPMVTVRLEDLRLLLIEAEPLLVSKETTNRPVVWAIDRMGDEVLKATMRAQKDRSSTEEES